MKEIFKKNLQKCIDERPEKQGDVIRLLSERLGCSMDTIYRWLRGQTQVSDKYFNGISLFFGRPTEYFISIQSDSDSDKERDVLNDLKMYKEMVRHLLDENKDLKKHIKELGGYKQKKA